MSFCVKDKALIADGQTVIDNSFIVNYMSDAPEKATYVYLLGLLLTDISGNCCKDIANKLDISEEDVIASFYYWEELGLVSIVPSTPPQIVYHSTSTANTMLKKIKPSKYTKFGKNIQSIIAGRMLNPSEYNEYYLFLEKSLFQPEALLAVAQYCVDLKGNNVSYQYILTVANNIIKQGGNTLETVAQLLSNNLTYDNDLKLVFKALRYKGATEHQHRELMHKWQNNMCFALDTIVNIAKTVKTGGMTKLNTLLEEYYSKGALSIAEIQDYQSNKESLYDTAKSVTRNIGVYYQSLDAVVDEYITKWNKMGYDNDTLAMLSKYCFKSNIRTLSGVDAIIDKLYKLGYTTISSINNYIDNVANTDKEVKNILMLCGLDRNVTASDRQLFKIWSIDWGLDLDVIHYACTKCLGTANAVQYLSKILSNYKTLGVTTVEQAKLQTTTTTTTAKDNDYDQHEYSQQEINALFTDLDNIKV